MAKRSRRRRGSRKLRKLLPRTKSGQLSRSRERRAIEALGEARELQTLRQEMFEDRARALDMSVEQAGDPISETIAGRLALRGVLSRAEAQAIDEYGRKVSAAHKAMLCPAGTRCSLNLARHGEVEDDPNAYRIAMRSYNDAFGILKAVGVRANRAVNIVVRDFIEPPISEIPELKLGAKALARHFGFDRASQKKQTSNFRMAA